MFRVLIFLRFQELNRILQILNKYKILDQFLNNLKNRVIAFQELGNKAFQILYNSLTKRLEMKKVILNMIQ